MSIRKRTLITAEIGPNHNGKIRYAEKIVKKLSKLDIDFIKFQFADPDEVYSLNSFKADYQIKNDGKSSIKEMSKRNQLKLSEHIKLAKLCKKLKKQYVCTVFDLKSMKKLNANLKIRFQKKKPNGTPRKKLDLSVAKRYGWKPSYKLNKGFDLTYKDYLNKIETNK